MSKASENIYAWSDHLPPPAAIMAQGGHSRTPSVCRLVVRCQFGRFPSEAGTVFKRDRDSERNPWRLKVNHWTWKQNIHFSRSPWNSNGTLGTRKEFWKRMRSVWLEILLCIWRDSTQFERAFFKHMERSLWTWMELSRKLLKNGRDSLKGIH